MLLRTSLLHERRSHRRAEKILLQHVLKNVSRSFYLSLSVLPGAMRKQVSLTYLPGKTASTAQALPDLATLDLYTYYVAGVVGEFWTKINKVHIQTWQLQTWQPHKLQALCALGVRFGKGLQMTNILRDLGKDLSVGRCYLPREQLEQLEVGVEEL